MSASRIDVLKIAIRTNKQARHGRACLQRHYDPQLRFF